MKPVFLITIILVASVQSLDDFIFKKYAMLKVYTFYSFIPFRNFLLCIFVRSTKIAMAKGPLKECPKRSTLLIPNVADKLPKELN